MRKVAALVMIAFACVAACSPLNVVAQRPVVNVISKPRLVGAYRIDLAGVPEGEYCARAPQDRDVCVKGFRSAYRMGLEQTMDAIIRRGSGRRYVVRFKMVEFSQSPAAVTAGRVAAALYVHMRWQFVLEEEGGRQLVGATGSTVGPKGATNRGNATLAVRALIEATLDEVMQAVDKQLAHGKVDESAGDDWSSSPTAT